MYMVKRDLVKLQGVPIRYRVVSITLAIVSRLVNYIVLLNTQLFNPHHYLTGTQYKYGREIKFRALLEQKLSERYREGSK